MGDLTEGHTVLIGVPLGRVLAYLWASPHPLSMSPEDTLHTSISERADPHSTTLSALTSEIIVLNVL